VTFLIDAYNLMHAVGLLRQGLPAKGLERARLRFLDWLADGVKGRAALLRVVFDAQDSPGASPERDHRGVRVRFAYRKTADDEIEELLAAERHPSRVAVVSNDTRVQEAGRRRGAGVRTCEEFVDWLIQPPVADPKTPVADAPGSPEKPEPGATADEMAAWLAAFSTPKRRKR
jgi:predicted RNA-binding protein with PIN domain